MYFLILIVFGALFAVNLLVAVLYVKFTEEGDTKEPEDDEEKDANISTEEAAEGDVPVTTWQENPVCGRRGHRVLPSAIPAVGGGGGTHLAPWTGSAGEFRRTTSSGAA